MTKTVGKRRDEDGLHVAKGGVQKCWSGIETGNHSQSLLMHNICSIASKAAETHQVAPLR